VDSRPTTQSNTDAAAKLRDKEDAALVKAFFVAAEQDLWMKDGVLFRRQAALQKLRLGAKGESPCG
jgi:hypothetical protein